MLLNEIESRRAAPKQITPVDHSQRFYYHFTKRINLSEIKQHGLHPRSASGEWEGIGYKDSVFFVGNIKPDTINYVLTMFLNREPTYGPDGGESWSEADWNRFEQSFIALTIDGNKIPNLQLEPDQYFDFDWIPSFFTKQPVPPSAIVNVQDVHFDWDESD